MQSLRRLTVSDSRSLPTYQDSDIFSATERVQIWAVVDDQVDDERNEELADAGGQQQQELAAAAISDGLRSFDTRQGVIRDIRYINSRFFGLHVTRDNVDALLRSENTQRESRELACSLLAYLQESWRVKGEMLDVLEFDWTGKSRREDQSHQEANFLVVAAVAAYLTPDWEQTRELSYLAVEEGAVDCLLKHSGWRLAEGHKLADLPFVDKSGFSDSVLAFRRQSAKNNLLACISRVCLSTGTISSRDEEHKDALSVISVEKSDAGVLFRADVVLKPDSTKRDFVRAMYDRHKVGRNEPFCPFLRASSVCDELGLPEDVSAPRHPTDTEASCWFRRTPDVPGMAEDKVLIVIASNPVAGCATPRLCLFVTDPAEVSVSGLQMFQELLHSDPRWHFRARRYDSKRGWSNGWNMEPEATVFRNASVARQLAAFAEALKTPDAHHMHSSQRRLKGAGLGSHLEHAWAPNKPNTKWDVLLTPGLEFMSDAMMTTHVPPHSASMLLLATTTTATNPRRIRQVNREDTPRPTSSLGPKSKGKERADTLNAEPGRMGKAESSCPPSVPTWTRQATAAAAALPPHRWEPLDAQTSYSSSSSSPALPSRLPNPQSVMQQPLLGEWQQHATVGASSPSHSPNSVRRKSLECDSGAASERLPKRHRSSHEQLPVASSASAAATPRRPGHTHGSSSQLLSIAAAGAEHKEIYLDDDAFAKLLADGFFSVSG